MRRTIKHWSRLWNKCRKSFLFPQTCTTTVTTPHHCSCSWVWTHDEGRGVVGGAVDGSRSLDVAVAALEIDLDLSFAASYGICVIELRIEDQVWAISSSNIRHFCWMNSEKTSKAIDRAALQTMPTTLQLVIERRSCLKQWLLCIDEARNHVHSSLCQL